MKRSSKLNQAGRFVLTGVAAATLCSLAPAALALGLGRMQVQSALGEALRAEIDVTSLSPDEASNLRVRVATPDAYKSAGVDYNPVLPGTQVELLRRADGRPYLRLTSDRGVQEPFVDVILEMNWSSGRLVREYTMLFDPPATARAPAPPPVTTAALAAPLPVARPVEPRRSVQPMAPVAAAPAVPPAAAPAVAAAPPPAPVRQARAEPPQAPTPAPRPAAADAGGSDAYRVRPGDSLSRIAARTQRQGVSLDQMLVSLYRGNPQAFIDNNMNRLRSGVVLDVPSGDKVRAVTPDDAHQVIQAQSVDFGAYRQRLAGIVPATRPEGSARQASGKVQAQVDEHAAGTTPTPDRLTLSNGRGTPPPVAPPPVAATTPPPPAAAPAPPPVAAAPVVPPAPVPSSVAPVAVLAAAASAATTTSPAPASAPAPATMTAASVPSMTPATRPARPAAPAVEEPGMLGSLLDDNPTALGLGGLALAALVAFGIWRFARRSRPNSSETSFLESRLQPDSFFGASGGQHIDTRDGAGTSTSMSYSLSQLDAIGDVDPVAEADVYLAYGRDLQAEEILKEAMRSTPERMAVRTKLLEVYAKRRDIKGFEQLATQLYALTNGEGEDWKRAQEIGAQLDPENALYRPGGAPAGVPGPGGGNVVEPLGASTLPQSVLPSPSQFAARATDSRPMDLDLDLDSPPIEPAPSYRAPMAFAPTAALPGAIEPTEARRPAPPPPDDDPMSLDFSLPDPPTIASRAASQPEPSRFDLSDLSLDLDLPDEPAHPTPASAPASQFGDGDLSFVGESEDPFERKLELAEEFRQIGDTDGARDLLREVVAESSGAVKSRAQNMLADLG